MFYRFINLISVLFCMFQINIAYCDEVEELRDIIDDGISVEEKLRFLEYVKNEPYQLSNEAFVTLNDILTRESIEIKLLVLEILLKDDIETFPEYFATSVTNIFVANDNPDRAIKNFLPLRVLIKSNTIKQGNYDYYIFSPFYSPIRTESLLLDNYEKYIITHLKYTTSETLELMKDRLKSLPTEELKISYVRNIMIGMDVIDFVIKTISDKSVELSLRREAIDSSLELLSYTLFNNGGRKVLSEVLEEIINDKSEDQVLKDDAVLTLQKMRLEDLLSVEDNGSSVPPCMELFKK